MSEKTVGEQRVRTDFNVEGDMTVDHVKQGTAKLINVINTMPVDEHRFDNPGEVARLKSLAMTAYEEACMWAVKALTSPRKDAGDS